MNEVPLFLDKACVGVNIFVRGIRVAIDEDLSMRVAWQARRWE